MKHRTSMEGTIQRAVFAHLRTLGAPDMFAFRVRNGGYRRPRGAAIMKGLGVVAGVPNIGVAVVAGVPNIGVAVVAGVPNIGVVVGMPTIGVAVVAGVPNIGVVVGMPTIGVAVVAGVPNIGVVVGVPTIDAAAGVPDVVVVAGVPDISAIHEGRCYGLELKAKGVEQLNAAELACDVDHTVAVVIDLLEGFPGARLSDEQARIRCKAYIEALESILPNRRGHELLGESGRGM
jgi:hypothetical protein